MERLNPQEAGEITSRLQKGGALLSDMRLMVLKWSEELTQADSADSARKILSKMTLARARDTYIRAFRPRFIHGSPPQAWKLAQILENTGADIDIIRSFYYWITARAEHLLYAFVTEEIFHRAGHPDREIRIGEAISWISSNLHGIKKEWTPTVQRKVARGLLAALRDFGILEGVVQKHIAPFHLPLEAFTLIGFCLNALGVIGRDMIRHPDWKLFLLREANVERLFMECHQHNWLRYQVAGDLYRLEFPQNTFEEYARAVLGR